MYDAEVVHQAGGVSEIQEDIMTYLFVGGLFLSIHNGDPRYLFFCLPLVLVFIFNPKLALSDIVGEILIALAVYVAYLYFSGKYGPTWG